MNAVQLIVRVCVALPPTVLLPRPQAPSPKPAFFVTLGPETQKVQLGTKVKVEASIVSTADVLDTSARGAMIGCSGAEIVHVVMKGGKEPEKTEYYRHLLGEFRPGDTLPSTSGSCFARPLDVGGTLPAIYDLSAYYRLTTPGRYDVWVEVNDTVRDPRDHGVRILPVRSNTAHFELVSGQ